MANWIVVKQVSTSDINWCLMCEVLIGDVSTFGYKWVRWLKPPIDALTESQQAESIDTTWRRTCEGQLSIVNYQTPPLPTSSSNPFNSVNPLEAIKGPTLTRQLIWISTEVQRFIHMEVYYNRLLIITHINKFNVQGPDLYAFIGFIGPDDDDLNWY